MTPLQRLINRTTGVNAGRTRQARTNNIRRGMRQRAGKSISG